jgi:uncharacterized protein with FMN-binding domain
MQHPPAALLAGASLASLATLALAGCTSQSASASGSGTTPASAGSDATFKDGTYTATGHYTSPGGDSAVAVKLTLKGGTVTAVTVTPKAENPTAQSYESNFASGVGGEVIGKKLTELNVTTVSGSSLTSQGFDKAVADIEARART